MNINKKVSLLFISILIFFSFLIFLIINNRVEKIESVEEKIILNNIKKVQNIFDTYLEKIDNVAYEYSTNSDILQNIKNKDYLSIKNYFKNKPDFMRKLDLSYFIILNKDKKRVYSSAYDLSSDETLDVPKELISYLEKKDLRSIDKHERFLTINYEKVVFSTEELVLKNKTVAYIFVARAINSSFLTKISEVVDDYASLVSNFGLNVDRKLRYKDKDILYSIKRSEHNRLFYHLKFYDSFEKESFYIRFQNDRQIYSSMYSELKNFIYIFFIMFVFLMLVFFFFMNKLFVNRINYITNIVKKVSLNETLKYQLRVSYDDEISYLIRKINEMFRVINAQQDLTLKKERDFLQSVLDTQQNIIMITDGKEIQSVNRKFREIFDSTDTFLENIALIDKRTKANFMAVAKRYNNKDIPAKFKFTNKERYFTFHVSKLDIRKYLICMNDVSTLNHKINHLSFIASTDELTSVYNKATITSYAKKWLKEKDFSMIIFDIDYFKKVNDTYGHYAGDCILKEMAKLVSREISKDDILGRFGGEEFLLLINDISRENVIKIANRVRKIVEREVFKIDEHKIKITISMGCTVCVYDEKFETLYKRADEALYEAKKTGRNKVVFY